MKEYLLKAIDVKPETKDIKSIRFGFDKEKMDFKPGQFITIFLEGTKKPAAQYSIASAPNEKYLEITVKPVGEFSTRLCNLKIGDEVRIRGPFGNFYFDGQFKNDVVLIAGGIGICPFRSMIENSIKKGIKNKITVLYSCRTSEDVVCYNELKNIKAKNIKIIFTITREKKGGFENGRIDANMIKKYVKDIENSVYYLCGLNDMVKGVKEMLKELGVKEKNIKAESWG